MKEVSGKGEDKEGKKEKEKIEEMLAKYGVVAPDEGGPLIFKDDGAAIEGEEMEGGLFEGVEDILRGGTGEGEDEDEDEETLRRRKDLEMRMAGVDIEDADFDEIWDRLDPREREEFVLLAQQLDQQERESRALQQ